jgi:acyl-CoA thioester hydrolase
MIEHSSSYRVYYEDTDLSGIVYHANYLKFFERAREEAIGMDNLLKILNAGFHLVVYRMDIKFIYPARHGDLIRVETQATISPRPILPFSQTAFVGDKKLCHADIQLAVLNSEHKAIRTPKIMLDLLSSQPTSS